MKAFDSIVRSPVALVALVLASSAAAQSGGGTGSVVALNGRGSRLATFDPGTPGRLASHVAISGLQPDEVVLGIDYRPATGDLVALGSMDRLYTIDLASGMATSIGTAPFTPSLLGNDVGVDFNPVPDRLRVVSSADENLRLNPDTGAVAGVDTPLAYAAGDANFGVDPNVVASAYTSNFAGATSTTLYGIDAGLGILVRQGSVGGAPISPNSGQIFTIGTLGVATSGLVGFDVSPFGGALLTLTAPGATHTQLYTVNLASGAATLLGTLAGEIPYRDIAIRPPAAPRIYGLTAANRLQSFRPGTPGSLLSSQLVTGLAAGETVLGIDFRPATGELIALGSTSRVYALDALTGAATPIGAAPFAPALLGTEFGVDFNPVPDRLRVVSDAEQNLRLDPNTGAVAGVDTPLAYAVGDPNFGADPTVVGAAYTNNFPGTPATTLFGIDAGLDALVRQGSVGGAPISPNGGQLFTVGALGTNTSSLVGFDVSVHGGAFASLTAPGASSSSLYALNLDTGAATLIAAVGGGEALRDIAIEPPAPARIHAVTASNKLISFAPGAAGTLLSSVPISGLQRGEQVVGLDARPATRRLYAVGSTSRVYMLDAATGAALAVGALPFAPPLSGADFGVDFNPVPDRIRAVSNADQNVRLNPSTGAVAGVDTMLAYAAGDPNQAADPNVVASAYTSNFTGATATTLFGLDTALDVLVRQGSPGGAPISPNSGQLFTIGALGVDAANASGFDVTIHGGVFASLTAPLASTSQLYAVNPTTGAATLIGAIGGGEVIRDIASLPPGI